jgi:hypothetical protein
MLHAKLVKMIENEIEGMDLDYLKRAFLLLQSDLWSISRSLDDRKYMEPDLIAELEAESDRIQRAIEKIGSRSMELDYFGCRP